MPTPDPLGPDPFEFLNYKRSGQDFTLDWSGGVATHRAVEAARLAIDRATKQGAEMAKHTHPWSSDTFQTEESVFQRLAHYNIEKQEVWGSWGVRSLPREPPRMAGQEPPYERPLMTSDVALLLEFGFTIRRKDGSTYKLKFPWLYPAWDASKVMLPLYIEEEYAKLPSNFRYRRLAPGGAMPFVSLADAYAGATVGRIVSVL